MSSIHESELGSLSESKVRTSSLQAAQTIGLTRSKTSKFKSDSDSEWGQTKTKAGKREKLSLPRGGRNQEYQKARNLREKGEAREQRKKSKNTKEFEGRGID